MSAGLKRSITNGGRGRSGVLCAVILAAGLSMGVSSPVLAGDLTSSVLISAPTEITIQLPTDHLAWDLCWGQHNYEACKSLADQAIEQMTDPEALYVINIPQLSPRWTPLRVKGHQVDFKGQHINKQMLANARLTYDRDVELAVIGLVELIREARPGAKLTVAEFGPVATKGNRGMPKFRDLADHLDFVVAAEFDRAAPKMPLERRVLKVVGKRSLDSIEAEGLPLLARNESAWYALGFSSDPIEDLLGPGSNSDDVWGGDTGSGNGSGSGDDSASDPENDDYWVDDNPPADPSAPGDDGFVADVEVPEEEEPAPPADEEEPAEDGGEVGGGGGGGGGGIAPVEPETFTITLPSQHDAPYGSQWGTHNQDSLLVYPAQYQAYTNTIVSLPLSFHQMNPPADNPRAWNYEFRGPTPDNFVLMEQGFPIVDGMMQMIYDAGYREVWIWGFSGNHIMNSQLATVSMSWLSLDGWTQPMIDTWPAFAQKWKNKGVKLGIYLGAINSPNFGTTLSPNHRWITRDDFEYIGDTVKQAKDLGFDVVAWDAFIWILSMRDMPEWANWGPAPGVGPRDKGISLDLMSYLRNRPDIQGIEYCGESMLPYGKFLAALPALELMTPNDEPNIHFDSLNTLEDPTIYDRVNPGREIIKMLGGHHEWDQAEYNAIKAKCQDYNYRLCVDYRVLQQMGEIGTLQPQGGNN